MKAVEGSAQALSICAIFCASYGTGRSTYWGGFILYYVECVKYLKNYCSLARSRGIAS